MVKVIDYAVRQRKEDGSTFVALILQGGLSLVKSQNTGNFYATVKQCSIPSTFDEATAKAMIGESVPGSVVKKSCEAYEWTNKDTGEVLQISHRWVYLPEGATLEEAIFEGDPQVTMADQKKEQPLSAR